jgi:hypothetical protein
MHACRAMGETVSGSCSRSRTHSSVEAANNVQAEVQRRRKPGRGLLAPLARVVAHHVAGRTRVALGMRGDGAIDLETLRWPDSQLARDAEQQARDELSPHVREHCYRTYLFGLALAAIDGVRVDEELVYVASLLPDLRVEHPTPGRCFAVAGAELAQAFVRERGAPPERAEAIAAAIAGHITVGAAEEIANPDGFVSAGAIVDVAGVRMHELDPAWVRAVLDRHPRLGFRRRLLAAFKAESKAVPAGRIRWRNRYAAFPLLIRAAPFDE